MFFEGSFYGRVKSYAFPPDSRKNLRGAAARELLATSRKSRAFPLGEKSVIRHADAGYEEAIAFAQIIGVKIPVTVNPGRHCAIIFPIDLERIFNGARK